MVINIVILIVLIAITVTCDFTPYTLSDNEVKLLYSDTHTDDDSIFGTSTVTGDFDANELQSSSAKDQAEELLNQIYNG